MIELITKYKKNILPTPNEIRKEISNMQICPRCQFIVFDNYFSDEIENISLKICPTCGYKI